MNKASRWLVQLTYWLPRLVALNGSWVLASLTLIGFVPATRAVALLVLNYQRQGIATTSVWQDFWQCYKQNHKRFDALVSLWLIGAGIDWFLMHNNAAPVFQIACVVLVLVLLGYGLVCCWRVAFVTPIPWLLAFVQCGHHLVPIIGQLVMNLFVIGLLALIGGGLTLLAGGALLIAINVRFAAHWTAKRLVQTQL